MAHRRRHHPQRHVLLRPRIRPPPPRGRQHRDRSSTSALPTRGPAGPGFAHSAAAKAGVKNMVETLAVEWGPYGIQVNGLVPGLFPHEDMTADIKGNLVAYQRQGRLPARTARRPAARARLGRHVPRFAVRALHLRPHPRGRRGELAAAHADQPTCGDGARPDGQGPVRTELNRAGCFPARRPYAKTSGLQRR